MSTSRCVPSGAEVGGYDDAAAEKRQRTGTLIVDGPTPDGVEDGFDEQDGGGFEAGDMAEAPAEGEVGDADLEDAEVEKDG